MWGASRRSDRVAWLSENARRFFEDTNPAADPFFSQSIARSIEETIKAPTHRT